MRKTAAMMMVAMLATAGSTFAAQQKAPEPAKKTAEQPLHTAKGTVKTFAEATNTLTISTAKGVEESFMVGPKTNLREGAKAIAVWDLAKLAGREATIRYMESEGQKHAESVMVSTHAPAKPAATSGIEQPKPTGESGKKD
jgi:hypothetical protein